MSALRQPDESPSKLLSNANGRNIPSHRLNVFEWRADHCWRRFAKRRLSLRDTQQFLDQFDSFAAFHACRSTTVEPYYRLGLQLANHDDLTAAAKAIFVSNEFPEISAEQFGDVTRNISRIDDRKTYLVLDDDELVRYCGHYLIYGSEHIVGIAAALTNDGRRDYMQVLKRFGVPTIFRLELPRDSIPADQLRQLSESLAEESVDFLGREEPPHLSWSFIFSRPIPGEWVKSHRHPEVIPDPLLQYREYRFRQDADM